MGARALFFAPVLVCPLRTQLTEQRELSWSYMAAMKGPGGSRTSSCISSKLSVAKAIALSGDRPRARQTAPAALCGCFLLLSGLCSFLFASALSLSVTLLGGAQGSPPPILMLWSTDRCVHVVSWPHSKTRTRTQGFWLPAQSSCLWTRLPGGERAAPLPIPPYPTEQGEVALACPRASDSMFTGYNAFGTTRPTFLGMLKDARCPPAVPAVHVHTALFCSPLPRPRHMGSGCFCRRSFLRPTVASYSFLWSICKTLPRESWGSAHFSLALCPEPGGKEGRLGEGHPPLNGPLTWEEAP